MSVHIVRLYNYRVIYTVGLQKIVFYKCKTGEYSCDVLTEQIVKLPDLLYSYYVE